MTGRDVAKLSRRDSSKLCKKGSEKTGRGHPGDKIILKASRTNVAQHFVKKIGGTLAWGCDPRQFANFLIAAFSALVDSNIFLAFTEAILCDAGFIPPKLELVPPASLPLFFFGDGTSVAAAPYFSVGLATNFAVRRSGSFQGGICHRFRVGLVDGRADGNAFEVQPTK